MRIGLVCPYPFDVPGGVQHHVRDLAETLIELGHEVSVLAPATDDDGLPPYVVSAGRALSLPYNGSVVRIAFGPLSAARAHRWIARGRFDVLHVHEPLTPSLSLIAVTAARGPVVATFHSSMTRSRILAAGRGIAQLALERITARIAVSELARRIQVEHSGTSAVEIPNGVSVARHAAGEPLPGWPRPQGAIGFLGRYTEPRKGFAILVDAFARIAPARPGLRLLVAGPGDPDEVLDGIAPEVRDRIVFLGKVSEADKIRMLHSVDIYAAPNTGGESFGMILTESMAAGTPVVASDLDAFSRVLDQGRAGVLVPVGDAAALAAALGDLLDDPDRRRTLAARGREVVRAYDWPVIAQRVLEVYQTAIAAAVP